MGLHRGPHYDGDCARQFSNQYDICRALKMVHGNWSDSHCNQSDTRPSVILLELY